MRVYKRIKRMFFKLTVKSPITVIVIIAFVVSSLLYISFTNYSGVYLKIKGTLQLNINSSDSPFVKINVNESYTNNIDKHTPVSWYCNNNGKRYKGSIGTIHRNEDKESLSININLSKTDVDIENPKEVTVELLIKKVRIIKKLTMKEGD